MTNQAIHYYIDVEGRSLELPEGEVTIGRSRNCTVAVKDVTVSRHHASIWFEAGKARVRDIGSSNGTFVNGKRVQGEASLVSGDKVSVGETEMQVRIAVPLESAEATVRIEFGDLFCPRCGAPVPRNATTCVACSHSIGAPAAAATPASTVLASPPVVAPPPMPTPASAPQFVSPGAVPPRPAVVTPAPMPPPAATFGPLPPAPVPAMPPPVRPAAAAPPFAAPPPPSPLGGLPMAAPAPPVAPAGEVLSSIRDIDLAPRPSAAPAPQRLPSRPSAPAPAGFLVRLGAYLIDVVALMVLYLIVTGPFFFLGRYGLASMLGTGTMIVAGLALALVGWGRFGTTPGKHLLGLSVTMVDAKPGQVGIGTTKALIRWLGYMVSGMVLGIGFLLIAFRPDKRGLHDLLAGTMVVRRR